MTFLKQDTAVAMGAENYAVKYDLPVIYAHLRPIERGRFNLRFTLLTDQPKESASGEITEMHAQMLEKQISAEPQYWLWSHRRWKKKRTVN